MSSKDIELRWRRGVTPIPVEEWMQRFRALLVESTSGRRAYEKLVRLGCVPAILTFYTWAYTGEELIEALTSPVRQFAKQKIKELADVDIAIGTLVQSGHPRLLRMLPTDAFWDGRNRSRELTHCLRQLSSRRGELRAESLLVDLGEYVNRTAGRPYYSELASILEIGYLSWEKTKDVCPEALAKTFKRFCKKYPHVRNAALESVSALLQDMRTNERSFFLTEDLRDRPLLDLPDSPLILSGFRGAQKKRP